MNYCTMDYATCNMYFGLCTSPHVCVFVYQFGTKDADISVSKSIWPCSHDIIWYTYSVSSCGYSCVIFHLAQPTIALKRTTSNSSGSLNPTCMSIPIVDPIASFESFGALIHSKRNTR